MLAKSKNIVFLSDDDRHGIAKKLSDTFESMGHKTLIIIKNKKKNGDVRILSLHKFKYIHPGIIFYKIKQYIRKNLKIHQEYYMFGLMQNKWPSWFFILKRVITFKPDVFIYLHPQEFLSVKNLYSLNKHYNAIILWYFMDMAPMTSACHYAWDCIGYTKTCGACPGLYSNDLDDQSNINWRYKKKYIDKTDIIPIAASEWQFLQLKASSLFKKKEHYKILLSIDEEIFNPQNKIEKRIILGIPETKRIIFFGAVNPKEKRKGFKELLTALNILKDKMDISEANNIHIVIAGTISESLIKKLPFGHTALGLLTVSQLVSIYQAADVYLSSSIEDSGPMMINQSIMSGTPVVAFEMGVALDLVITGKTGYRAILKDCSDFAQGIKYILELNDDDYNKMSRNCRKLGLELCHSSIQAKKFMEIINRLALK